MDLALDCPRGKYSFSYYQIHMLAPDQFSRALQLTVQGRICTVAVKWANSLCSLAGVPGTARSIKAELCGSCLFCGARIRIQSLEHKALLSGAQTGCTQSAKSPGSLSGTEYQIKKARDISTEEIIGTFSSSQGEHFYCLQCPGGYATWQKNWCLCHYWLLQNEFCNPY